MKIAKTLLSLLLLISAASVLAAPANRPCRGDVQEYCSEAVGDRRAIGQCIRENLDKVSEECRVAVSKRMEARRSGEGGRPASPTPPALPTEDGNAEDDQ